MIIYSNLKNSIKQMAIIEKIKKEDSIEFIEKVLEQEYEVLEITFFNAKTLPIEILNFLINIETIKEGIKLKIFALSYYLYTYLNKVGIEAIFIHKKRLTSEILDSYKALVIGGSSDSLDKIYKIIDSMVISKIPIFIIQHLKEDSVNLLDKLLQKRTNYIVETVDSKKIIQENRIYIAPSSFHMKVKDGFVFLENSEAINYAKPSIDVLFESLSIEYKESLISILLCGYGVDGISSLNSLYKNKSFIIIENPQDCKAKLLPQSAIENGKYNLILSIEDIQTYLQLTFLKLNRNFDSEIISLLEEIKVEYGYDFTEYDLSSIKRRINYFMKFENITTIENLRYEVLKSSEVFENLMLAFSINVTSFFRDAEFYKTLKSEILPYLNSFSHIKIWCAGCSSGQEAYSLAILLDELNMLSKTQIYATDFNKYIIDEAKKGIFSLDSLNESLENYQKFSKSGNFTNYIKINSKNFQVEPYLKEKILFFQHSLTSNGVLNEFQLIICRNVLIYFSEKLKVKVIKNFHQSLDGSGFLALGASEKTIPPESKKYFSKYLNNIFKPNRFGHIDGYKI